MTFTFTDTQLVLLSAAAQREDRCLAPSQRMQGVVAKKFEEKLINASLAIEVAVVTGMPVWRRGADGDPIALRLTAAGLAAIGIEEDSVAVQVSIASQRDAIEATAFEQEGVCAESGEVDRDALEPPLKEISHGDPHAESKSVPAQTGEESAAPAGVEPGAALIFPSSASGGDPVAGAAPNAPRAGSKLAVVIELLHRPHGATIDELTTATGWLAHTTRAAITGLRKRNFIVALDRSDKARGSVYRARLGGAESPRAPGEAEDGGEAGEGTQGAAAEPASPEPSPGAMGGDPDADAAVKTSSADLAA